MPRDSWVVNVEWLRTASPCHYSLRGGYMEGFRQAHRGSLFFLTTPFSLSAIPLMKCIPPSGFRYHTISCTSELSAKYIWRLQGYVNLMRGMPFTAPIWYRYVVQQIDYLGLRILALQEQFFLALIILFEWMSLIGCNMRVFTLLGSCAIMWKLNPKVLKPSFPGGRLSYEVE